MALNFQMFRQIITQDLVQAHAIVAEEEVVAIKQTLSKNYPPASQPGQPPARRTGNLQDGVHAITVADSDQVFTTITSSRVDGNPLVPWWLEHGTKKMAPRSYLGQSRRRMRDTGLRRIAAAGRGGGT